MCDCSEERDCMECEWYSEDYHDDLLEHENEQVFQDTVLDSLDDGGEPMPLTIESHIYLAAPYSHYSEHTREWRFAQTTMHAGRLVSEGYKVFSPITHSHPIVEYYPIPKSWDFWKRFDESMIHEWADALVVLALPGWQHSEGVKHEVELALSKNFPLYLWEREVTVKELFASPRWDGSYDGSATR